MAPVRRFTFYCDGFFWLGCTAYSANRWLVRPHVSSAFVRGHLNDVWLIPCALPLVSWLHERCGWRTDEGPPRLAEIAAHVAGWSVLFEWIGPKYLPWTTADAWDVVWYAVGATLGWVWGQRTSRAGRKLMGFDAIVSHFFLDCFTAEELAAIVRRVADWSAPGALWVVSDFRVPDRGWRRRRAQAIHALMYTALRYVTRISARAVSPPDASLARAGFALISRHVSNQGLLHADLWRLLRQTVADQHCYASRMRLRARAALLAALFATACGRDQTAVRAAEIDQGRGLYAANGCGTATAPLAVAMAP